MAAQIKTEIAESRAKSEISSLRDKIEDERAAGLTLAEIARKLGLKAVNVEAVDRSGRGPDGKPVAGVAQTPNVINAVFGSDVGVDTDALQLPGGGYLYFDVTAITPSRERPLDEVKDEVAARWRDGEISKRLQAKADDIIGKLKAGTPFSQVASEAGLKVEAAADLQRGKQGGFVPAKVVEAVFRTPKGAPGTAEGNKETDRYVFRVTDVVIRYLMRLRQTAKLVADGKTPIPKTLSANISRGWKMIWCHRQSTGAEPGHAAAPNNKSIHAIELSKSPLPNAKARRSAGGVDHAGPTFVPVLLF